MGRHRQTGEDAQPAVERLQIHAHRRPCRDRCGGRDGRVYTTVTNSGPGIAPDKLPHIFERFFTGAHLRPLLFGVGLSYVKSLVELHDGAIGIRSPAKNSTRASPSGSPCAPGCESIRRHRRYNPEIFDESRRPRNREPEADDPAYLEMERQTVVLGRRRCRRHAQHGRRGARGRFCMEGVAMRNGLEVIGSKRIDILVWDVMLGEREQGSCEHKRRP